MSQPSASGPSRPVTCGYSIEGGSVFVPGYENLVTVAKDGDRVNYFCAFQDEAGGGTGGQFIYGQDPPPATGPTARERARALRDVFVERNLQVPTVESKPPAVNQRVGFDSWFALPTFQPVPSSAGDPADVQITVEPIDAVFTVPVERERTETFQCTESGVGSGGEPNGRCHHRFDWATGGRVQATITIRYQFRYTSLLTGEIDIPFGVVPRTGTVEMQVRDLQAVAS